MMNGIPRIDVEAFEAFDARTLLRVLARAIEEEMAERRERGHASVREEGERVEVLRRLVDMIQVMLDIGLDRKAPSGGKPGLKGL